MTNKFNENVEIACLTNTNRNIFYKYPLHLKSFYDLLWQKFSVKVTFERLKNEFDALREELAGNTSNYLPVVRNPHLNSSSQRPNSQSSPP